MPRCRMNYVSGRCAEECRAEYRLQVVTQMDATRSTRLALHRRCRAHLDRHQPRPVGHGVGLPQRCPRGRAFGYRRIRRRTGAQAAGGDPFARMLPVTRSTVSREEAGPSPGIFFILSAGAALGPAGDVALLWRRGRVVCHRPGSACATSVPSDADCPLVEQPSDPRMGRLIRQRPWSPSGMRCPISSALVAAVFEGLPRELAAAPRTRFCRGEADARTGMVDAASERLPDDMEQALV